MRRLLAITIVVLAVVSVVLAQTKVKKENVPGITNFARVETTVACAGAVTTSAVSEIKKMGFAAIFNLRQANEPGVDIDAEAAAAKEANIKFFHIPMNSASPDPAVVDRFLKTISEKGNE